MTLTMEKIFSIDKRKRMQVPKTILSAGVFLIFYPIVNLFGIAFYYKNFSLDFLSKNILRDCFKL